MNLITGAAGSGKTRYLVHESARTKAYIVCHDQSRAHTIQQHAREIGINIPLPITYQELETSRGIRSGILIDDIDHMLRILFRQQKIHALTMCTGVENQNIILGIYNDKLIERDTEASEKDTFTKADLQYFMHLARKDERQAIAREIYAQQAEIIKIDGIRTLVVEVHKLQAILPEEQLPF